MDSDIQKQESSGWIEGKGLMRRVKEEGRKIDGGEKIKLKYEKEYDLRRSVS